jgi:hypothetical protein
MKAKLHPDKCEACAKATKVSWWRMAWHYVKSLWVYWRLPAKDRAYVKRLMSHPEEAPRVPNKPLPYRFWCERCGKLVPDKDVLDAVDLQVPPRFQAVGSQEGHGPVDEGGMLLQFRVHCHGQDTFFCTSVVAAYVHLRCHETVFHGEKAGKLFFDWDEV